MNAPIGEEGKLAVGGRLRGAPVQGALGGQGVADLSGGGEGIITEKCLFNNL